jgi:hypothetical protein
MSQYERLILLAEDQLTEYSSDARKIEKLRQKIGLSVSRAEQQQVKEQLIQELPDNLLNKLMLEQRQAVALPFWGIAGLGMLLGISMMQPLDIIPTVLGIAGAIGIQKYGWKIQAKKLVLQTLQEIDESLKKPN